MTTPGAGEEGSGSVAELASGNLIMVWHANSASTTMFDIKGQLLDPAGNKIGAEFRVNTRNGNDQIGATVSALQSGGFVVTWNHYLEPGFPNTEVRGQIFDANGNTIAGDFAVDPPLESGVVGGHTVVLPDGGFIVSYSDIGWYGRYVNTAFFQRFDAAGQPFGERVSLGAGYAPLVTLVPGGGWLAVWGTDPKVLKGQYFDAAGATVGPQFLIADPGTGVVGLGGVGTLASGDIVVAYHRGPSLNETEIFVQNITDGWTFVGTDGPDTFFAGDGYTPDDKSDGSNGTDTLVLQGSYDVAMGPLSMLRIERLELLSSADSRYGGGGGSPFHYVITPYAETSADGGNLTIRAAGLQADESLTFMGGNESDGSFTVYGGAGADRITTGAGRDMIDGGAGADVMAGGANNDIYYVTPGDTVIEAPGGGSDYAYASASFTLPADAEVEVLGTTNHLATTQIDLAGNGFNNNVIGNNGVNGLVGRAGNDYLTGLGGADVLDGGEGIDFTVGGAGGDIHYVDNPADIVLENVGEGYDAIYTSTSIGLREGVEVERIGTMNYLATTDIYLTGNEFGQDLIANNGNNQLSGMGGNDYLVGLDGVDILDGGTGADVMEGGAGGDIYYIDNAGDVVREMAGGGQDALYTSASYMLSAGSSVETLGMINYLGTEAINLGGNEFDNTVTGNNGNNILTGGGGSDYLNALEGNDVVDGGAGQDFLSGGAGADTYRFEYAADSVVGAADTIIDFTSGTDRIDLSLVDAHAGIPGRDSFTAIGSNAFSGKAGELRWESSGSQTFIFGDTNGDGQADFAITVNTTLIVFGDFIM
jgi:Ca2+-binding RTX toxin-like protein